MSPCVTPYNSVTQLSITPEQNFPERSDRSKRELRRVLNMRCEAVGGRHLLRAYIQRAVRGGVLTSTDLISTVLKVSLAVFLIMLL